MRQVGTLPNEQQAAVFAAYLAARGIRAQVDAEPPGWSVWVIDEDRVAQGREELAAFQANPEDPRYAKAIAAAKPAEAKPRAKVVNLRRRWETPGSLQPLVTVLLGISIFVHVFSNYPGVPNNEEDGPSVGRRLQYRLMITDPSTSRIAQPTLANQLPEVRKGQVWRLFTPMFLHFSLLHIIFNLMMLQMLGNAVEFRIGTWAATGLVLVIALVSNLAQYEVALVSGSWFPGNFGGMSGVVYGLFGYVWAKGKFDPGVGLAVSQQTTIIMMGWLLVCIIGIVPNVANTAHVAGLLAGGVAAVVPLVFRLSR